MKKLLLLVLFLFIPINVFAEEKFIPNGTSGILIEANSGKILFEKEKDKQVSVASMTKMMAQILILERVEAGKIKWSDIVTVSKNAADMGGSQIYLGEGEKMSVEDLMKGISVASGNDATVAMAEYISGSEEKFVSLMNKKAKELGLKNTHFVNCTGLDVENHYSSSYDMAMIARELVINHPEILRFSSIYEDYLREDTQDKFWLVNTNKLINFYSGADGLKTGHTDAAGYCLAATAKRNDLRLIAIVLGEKDSKIRNTETISLLDYGFNSVKMKNLLKKGTVVKKIGISKGSQESVDVKLKNNLNILEDVGSDRDDDYQYDVVVDELKLPIKKGAVVGKIVVKDKKKVVAEEKLIIEQNVEKLNVLKLFLREFKNLVFGNF